jgi:hypothetical protein
MENWNSSTTSSGRAIVDYVVLDSSKTVEDSKKSSSDEYVIDI